MGRYSVWVAVTGLVAGALAVSCGSSDKSRKARLGHDDAGAGGSDAGTSPVTPGAGGKQSTGGAPPVKEAGVIDASVTPEAGPPDASVDASPEAAAPLNGLFVNPTTGLNTNTGEQGNPYLTIAQAIGKVAPGQNIYLEDGTYDATNQTSLNFPFIPAGVNIVGLSTSGVTIASAVGSNDTAFVFTGAGGIQNVHFQNTANAVTVHNSGTFTAKNVHFDGVSRPFFFSDTVVATVDATSPDPIFTNIVPDTIGMVGAEIGADVTFTGGDIESAGTGFAVFFARDHSKLKVVGTTVHTASRHALVVYDNAQVTLQNVNISAVNVNSSGVDNSAITMGGQNGEVPTTSTLTLVNTSVSDNGCGGIGLTIYNAVTHPVLTFTNSHVDRNTGNGLLIEAFGGPAGQDIDIEPTDTTFTGNTVSGISASHVDLKMTRGALSTNGANGLVTLDTGFASSVKLRGVAIAGNTLDAISFTGPAGSTFDLGTTLDPGGVVFTQVAASPKAAVSLLAPIAGTAIGNTWVPSVQGSNAQGKFTTPTTIPAGTVGNNVTTAAGASLVVQ